MILLIYVRYQLLKGMYAIQSAIFKSFNTRLQSRKQKPSINIVNDFLKIFSLIKKEKSGSVTVWTPFIWHYKILKVNWVRKHAGTSWQGRYPIREGKLILYIWEEYEGQSIDLLVMLSVYFSMIWTKNEPMS